MVLFDGKPVTQIVMPAAEREVLISHCLRKLEKRYEAGEVPEPKAFGLIGGKIEDGVLTAARVAPLRGNARYTEPYKTMMDKTMGQYAITSETPLERRGWVASPDESRRILMGFDRDGLELVGNYHMHRVAWPHDPLRDTPAELDTVLATGTKMFMFIVSAVNPAKPLVRAFYEGEHAGEVPITVGDFAAGA